MNLVADEGVDLEIIELLRSEGYNVFYIAEMQPSIPDDIVLSKANESRAPLLTTDKDFGELVYRQRRLNSGVVLIRLAGLTPQRKAEVVGRAFRDHATEMVHKFTVITPGMVRIRKQP